MSARVFLATDYGLDDEFVGVLHAVIARVAPEVRVIDLSHGIAAFDVEGGAALLARSAPHLGPGVLCAVVDPGVGSLRRRVALEVVAAASRPGILVGPDNGLLVEAALALGGVRRAVDIDPGSLGVHDGSATFDGRDVFAPAAALLASGTPLEALGAPIEPSSLVTLDAPYSARRALPDGRVAIVATARWIDRFGNVALSLPGSTLEGVHTVGLAVGGDDALVRVVRTFSDLEEGSAGLLCDANGSVALVVANASAASRFDLVAGDRVELVGTFGRPE